MDIQFIPSGDVFFFSHEKTVTLAFLYSLDFVLYIALYWSMGDAIHSLYESGVKVLKMLCFNLQHQCLFLLHSSSFHFPYIALFCDPLFLETIDEVQGDNAAPWNKLLQARSTWRPGCIKQLPKADSSYLQNHITRHLQVLWLVITSTHTDSYSTSNSCCCLNNTSSSNSSIRLRYMTQDTHYKALCPVCPILQLIVHLACIVLSTQPLHIHWHLLAPRNSLSSATWNIYRTTLAICHTSQSMR